MTAHPCPELKQKITLLKTKQRKVQRHYLYRSLVVSMFAGGILASILSGNWQIKDRSQITIIGDRLIDSAIISNSINITYPQSIITIPSQQIESQLQSISALQAVQVTKTIFPLSVNIYLQERIPVATALSLGKVGFLDSQGVWLEPILYNHQQANFSSTAIKVVNFKPQYSSIWSEIYSLITAYPTLDVQEVHWEDGGKLSLVTSRFKVIFGADYSLLQRQFETLASFPDLATNRDLQNIAQIDLTNPDAPFLEQ
ncbi:Cell division septal protein [Hyella patelloides LEGE 07179]|uniref:Cell division septal protein n=1 Tax=Hyella patelloides LEGE 07179 TaxID=945734 RepID=A0A563VUD3_9CYAN|nr:FtsQ-type POTRA domain-containing protein [Hyella patelloides]VEP15004.1 Cell division septal protein [Hyella patelloides LEGE 07179]